ncbi:hypothetical protein nvc2_080 [Namao virus]|nr:hypothetical protein nvc2_080 [Namao virus]
MTNFLILVYFLTLCKITREFDLTHLRKDSLKCVKLCYDKPSAELCLNSPLRFNHVYLIQNISARIYNFTVKVNKNNRVVTVFYNGSIQHVLNYDCKKFAPSYISFCFNHSKIISVSTNLYVRHIIYMKICIVILVFLWILVFLIVHCNHYNCARYKKWYKTKDLNFIYL